MHDGHNIRNNVAHRAEERPKKTDESENAFVNFWNLLLMRSHKYLYGAFLFDRLFRDYSFHHNNSSERTRRISTIRATSRNLAIIFEGQ